MTEEHVVTRFAEDGDSIAIFLIDENYVAKFIDSHYNCYYSEPLPHIKTNQAAVRLADDWLRGCYEIYQETA